MSAVRRAVRALLACALCAVCALAGLALAAGAASGHARHGKPPPHGAPVRVHATIAATTVAVAPTPRA